MQVSLDERLLKRIDAQSETKRSGRSAFIRVAVEAYLLAKHRKQTDEALRAAYTSGADDMQREIAEIIEVQTWPEP